MNSLPSFPKRIFFYGFDSANDYQLKKLNDHYQVYYQGEVWAKMSPPMPGDHNALNATAALVAGSLAGLEIEQLVTGIESFCRSGSTFPI